MTIDSSGIHPRILMLLNCAHLGLSTPAQTPAKAFFTCAAGVSSTAPVCNLFLPPQSTQVCLKEP